MIQAVLALTREVGPALVFLVVNRWSGLTAAIWVSLVWTAAELALLVWRRQRPTLLFSVSTVLVVVFGAVDLWLASPVLIRFEASLINLVMAFIFGASIFRERSLIQEFAEKREARLSETAVEDRRYFFSLLTGVWAFYYLVRAAGFAFLDLGGNYGDSLLIRFILGMTSFWLLFAASIFLSKPVWRLFWRFNLMPSQRV